MNATGQGILNNNPGCPEQNELEIMEYVKNKLLSAYYELELVMRTWHNTKALATNKSHDSEDKCDHKTHNGLTLDDTESESDCTSPRTDDFTASIEVSTIGLKDDLESMKDADNSEDEKGNRKWCWSG